MGEREQVVRAIETDRRTGAKYVVITGAGFAELAELLERHGDLIPNTATVEYGDCGSHECRLEWMDTNG
jgi:phosphoheptose isomerase